MLNWAFAPLQKVAVSCRCCQQTISLNLICREQPHHETASVWLRHGVMKSYFGNYPFNSVRHYVRLWNQFFSVAAILVDKSFHQDQLEKFPYRPWGWKCFQLRKKIAELQIRTSECVLLWFWVNIFKKWSSVESRMEPGWEIRKPRCCLCTAILILQQELKVAARIKAFYKT